MIHTATITYGNSIDTRVSKGLFEQFMGLTSTQWMPQKKAFINKALQSDGIVVTGSRHTDSRSGYTWYSFSIRINFIRLIEKENRITVFTEQYTDAVANKFNRLLSELCFGMPDFYQWRVNRIDYCINVYTEHVPQYINLLRKGDKPWFLDVPRNAQGNYTRPYGSVYYAKGKRHEGQPKKKTTSIAINFYDKESQLKHEQARQIQNHEPVTVTEEMIQQAHNILRLEVQCNKPRTDYLKVKYDMTTKNLHYFLQDDIGIDVLTKGLRQVAMPADYKTKSAVIAEIDSMANWQHTTKDRLIQLVESISRRHNAVWKYRDTLTSEDDKKALRRDLKRLESMGINVVTIADNEKTLSAEEKRLGLTSVVELALKAIQEECIQHNNYIDAIELDED